MANTITVTAQKANTTKAIEYKHPVTGVWQDSNVFTNVPAGIYNLIECRLKGSSPAIAATWTQSVTVTNGSGGGTGTKATPPRFGTIDDTNNIVSLTSDYSYTEVVWGVEGGITQQLGSNSICSPGNIAGRLYAYVVANPATNRLQSETVFTTQPFTLTTANNTPTVSLSSPQSGQTIPVGEPIVLNATPQDTDGSADIKRVDHLDNGVKFAETTAFPHTVQRNISAGAHSYTARVYDTAGASSLSNAVQITGGVISGKKVGILGIGNSIMAGALLGDPATQSFVAQLVGLATDEFELIANTAVTGQSVKTLRASLQGQALQYLTTNTFAKYSQIIVIGMEAVNGFGDGSVTLQGYKDDWTYVGQQIRATGAKFIVMSGLPCANGERYQPYYKPVGQAGTLDNDPPITTAKLENLRRTLNDWFYNNYQTFADAIFDVGRLVAGMSTTNEAASQANFIDGQHPNQTGYGKMATFALPLLRQTRDNSFSFPVPAPYVPPVPGNYLSSVLAQQFTGPDLTTTAGVTTASGTGFGHVGLSDQKQVGNGRFNITKYVAGKGKSIIGTSPSAVAVPQGQMSTGYGYYVENGVIILAFVDPGAPGGQVSISPVVGTTFFCENRQGAVTTCEMTTNSGASWVVMKTYSTTSTADVFLVCDVEGGDGYLNYPSGLNLTPASGNVAVNGLLPNNQRVPLTNPSGTLVTSAANAVSRNGGDGQGLSGLKIAAGSNGTIAMSLDNGAAGDAAYGLKTSNTLGSFNTYGIALYRGGSDPVLALIDNGQVRGNICPVLEGDFFYIGVDRYIGACFLFRSSDQGLSWQRVDVPGGINFYDAGDLFLGCHLTQPTAQIHHAQGTGLVAA